MTTSRAFAVVFVLAAVVGCSKEQKPEGAVDAGAPTSTASTAASGSAAASASAAPSASASAAPLTPRSDCPKGSSGPGTFDKPCEAHGGARIMEAKWTGKTDEKGPHFGLTNKGTLTVLYGRVVVYFYDKAGKQLDSKSGKHSLSCSGASLFGGTMKPGEKAVLTFSCTPKDDVPDGATAIEAEIPLVGFADATEKKNDFYWKNDDLVPEARKKGGVK